MNRAPVTHGDKLAALRSRPQSQPGPKRGVDFPWVAHLRSRTVVSASGCWEWRGALTTGYGWVRYLGRAWLVHRLMWTLVRGEIPDDLTIDHLCRNRACCNPDHLEVVPQRINNWRAPAHAERFSRTHCPQGHEYTPANTYVTKRNQRQCKACRSRWQGRRTAA